MPGHRRSVRLATADYAAPGLYFVTVTAAERWPVFGRIVDGVVRLSDAGRVAHGEWLRTGEVRPGVALDAFVVMPDHVHLLFWIVPDVHRDAEAARRGMACHALSTPHDRDMPGTPATHQPTSGDGLPTAHDAGITPGVGEGTARRAPTTPGSEREFGRPVAASVSTLIGAYKSAVSRLVGYPVWQRGYHDRIVRDAREAANVRRYIAENPARASGGALAQNTRTTVRSRR